MNEILIMALANRVKAETDNMTLEQVPIPYKERVEEVINNG